MPLQYPPTAKGGLFPLVISNEEKEVEQKWPLGKRRVVLRPR